MVLLCEPEKKPSQVGSFMKKVEWVKFWNEVLLMIRSRICGLVCRILDGSVLGSACSIM